MTSQAQADWTHLEVIDRETGEVERIRLDDGNAAASVEHVADVLGMPARKAWEVLLSGQALLTTGFMRRLAR